MFLHKNVFGENPPDDYDRYILRHDDEFEIAADTEFVLARNFNGELKRVNFKMDLESTFLHRPRLSALGTLLCSLIDYLWIRFEK